jgi:hypothetical protein
MSSTGISHHKINAFSLVYPRLVLVSSDIIGQNKCSTPVTMSQERALDFIFNFFMEIKETLSQFLISLDIHRLAYCIVSKREISHRQKKVNVASCPWSIALQSGTITVVFALSFDYYMYTLVLFLDENAL